MLLCSYKFVFLFHSRSSLSNCPVLGAFLRIFIADLSAIFVHTSLLFLHCLLHTFLQMVNRLLAVEETEPEIASGDYLTLEEFVSQREDG